MSYDGRILRRAAARYEEDRVERDRRFRARQRMCREREPRLGEIDAELAQTMPKLIAEALRDGADPTAAAERVRNWNLTLQRERGELLASLGWPPDYLEPQPACAACGDRGWIGREMCACLRAYYVREQNQELSRMLDLGSQSFDTFRLDYYSDTNSFGRRKSARENMERNLKACRRFARGCPAHFANLLLTGDPGLGKTFLSACVAREVSEKGSVVYDTAAHVFARFEDRKFGRDEDEGDGDVGRVMRCDLLILDDLGTEMTTAFVQSALYQIVNARLLERRSTIISTNLNPAEIGRRYGEPILSRLRGEYELLPFYGEDVRLLKQQRAIP